MTMLGGILGAQPGAVAALTAPTASPPWRVVSSPDQPHATSDILNGVSSSAADCMAVGDYVIVGGLAYGFAATSKYTSLIMDWNGRGLSTLPSLTVRGFPDSFLDGRLDRSN